jgi:protein-S-isoprenylcysteine O-methyltransferase Ste14
MADSDREGMTPPKLERAGVLRLVTVAGGLLVTGALFFGAAGTTALPRGWLYYGGLFGYLVVATTIMLVFFPRVMGLINERGKVAKRDVKPWDKVLAILYTVLLLGEPVVAGIDAGGLLSTRPSPALALPTLALTILAQGLVHWAMVVNKHAETGVRIQHDRHHTVVSTGPYRFVRHPFYLSITVTQLAYPLAIGSWLAYVPALAIVVLFVWRTAREDATLRQELAGYEDYCRRTRYRLLPAVW